MPQTFDEKDQEILAVRAADLAALTITTPGDWIDFADGESRRIGYIHRDQNEHIQPAKAGSFYLGFKGWVDVSGHFRSIIEAKTLTLTDEKREGAFWFFHHGEVKAGGRVDCTALCRVWKCSDNVPTY